MLSTEEVLILLRGSGHRVTRQRMEIIDYVAERNDHPSARQIYLHLRGLDSRLSLATVYNTLSVLVDLGALTEMDFEASDNRYDTNIEPHINLVCTVCGAITDVNRRAPVSADEIQNTFGFETTCIRMEYRGKCASCCLGDRESGVEES